MHVALLAAVWEYAWDRVRVRVKVRWAGGTGRRSGEGDCWAREAGGWAFGHFGWGGWMGRPG